MARRQCDVAKDGNGFGRRSFLTMVGATAAATTIGFAGSASAHSTEYDPDQVVDLGEKGLTNGDLIDPYLEQYYENDVEVRVPEGEYAWNGGGFHLGATRNAGVIGEGQVVLDAVDGYFYNNFRAEGGTLVVRNFTVRGTVSGSRNRAEAGPDGRVVLDNWNFPDGSTSPDRSRPWYVPGNHAGSVEFYNSYFAGFSDNAVYASSPAYENDARDGIVIVEECLAHNNNIAGIRIGSSNSVVRNCVVVNDAPSPRAPTGRNQRGIWVRGQGDDQLIENCEVIHTYEGAGVPVNFGRHGNGSSGHMQDVRIHNDTSAPACNAVRAWSGERIAVSGSGNQSLPDWFDTCNGGSCGEFRGRWERFAERRSA